MSRTSAVLAVALCGLTSLGLSIFATTASAAVLPLTVAPYSGFNASLTRAPYVTDLTQTSAYVNWATSSPSPGSVQVAPAVNGSCTASVTVWSSASLPAPTALPGPVNPTSSGSSASMTSWAFSVTGKLGTTNEYQASVPVSGLSPSTTYCYAVFSTDQAGAVNLLPPAQPDQLFTTLDPVSTASTTPLTFDVIGDTGENYADTTAAAGTNTAFPGGVNPDQASIEHQIGQSGAKLLLMAGDISYTGGTDSSYGDLHQTGTQPEVSNVFGPSYFPETGGIPTYAAEGNHGQTVTSLRTWPTPNTAASSGGTYAFDSYSGVDNINGSFPDGWYAFSSGNVRIYVIDAAWNETAPAFGSATGSLCGVAGSIAAINCEGYQADADQHWQTTSPEYKWLQADLAAHPGGVKFSVFHFPLRSDTGPQPTDPYLINSSANPHASTSLEALLSKYGVDLAFNGHAHNYERIVPTGPGQITNYVTGGGGSVPAAVLGGTTCRALQAAESIYAIGWDAVKNIGWACGTAKPVSAAQVYSFLKVTVVGGTVTVSPTNATGQVFDQQTYTFPDLHSSPPSTPPTVGSNPPSPTVGPSGPSSTVGSGGATPVVGMASTPDGSGYWLARTNGGVVARGSAVNFGGMNGTRLNSPIAHIVSTPDGRGYWLVAGDGGTFAFGDAGFYGSMGGKHLNAPVVDIAPTRDGKGYWLVASDGGIFSFGNARFHGSMGGHRLNMPVVGIAPDYATGGYWEVATDGGIFSFGAPFFGSTGAMHLNKPVNSMTATPDDRGYWFVASDGGIFSFGDAQFHGSMGGTPLNAPVVGMATDGATGGYWLVASDGGVFGFDAPFHGAA